MNYKESLRRGNLSANCAGNLAQPDVASILVKVPADGGVDELLPAAPGVVAPWPEWPGRCLCLNLLCQGTGTGNQHTDEREKFDMGQYIHKCCQQILQRGYYSIPQQWTWLQKFLLQQFRPPHDVLCHLLLT